MDALASALMSIRLTSPLLARLTLGTGLSLDVTGSGPSTRAIPFHYIVSGSCRLVTGSDTIELLAGDMVMLPRTPEHRLETGDGGEALQIVDVVRRHSQPLWTQDAGLDAPLVLHAGHGPEAAHLLSGLFTLDGAQATLTLTGLPDCVHMPEVGKSLAGLMQATLSFIASEDSARPGFAATSSRLLEAILSEGLRIWVLTQHHPPGILRGLMDPVIAPLLQAIYQQPGRDWSVTAMARYCGMSRSVFAREFRAALEITPAAFVANARCEQAERLMADSDMPIAKIAFALGYGSAFAFSRAFRAQRNLTPAAFRRARGSVSASLGRRGSV